MYFLNENKKNYTFCFYFVLKICLIDIKCLSKLSEPKNATLSFTRN